MISGYVIYKWSSQRVSAAIDLNKNFILTCDFIRQVNGGVREYKSHVIVNIETRFFKSFAVLFTAVTVALDLI